VQPPPDLALQLLTITAETMRVIVRDLLIPVVALGITLATLKQPVPRLPRPITPAPDVVTLPAAAAGLSLAEERTAWYAALEARTVADLRQMARAAGHKALARTGRKTQLLEVLA
jgi:hypothetical protein